ncbi:MAG: type II toxin-antitoxin system RelB/DinJ family antitoxin [Thalassobaculales bacterium]
MRATTMVHVRVDEQTKADAAAALAAMGLSISDAVRVLLRRIAVEKALPFPVRLPNAETLAAMAEADEIARNRSARFTTAGDLFDDLEEEGGR